MRKVGPIVFLLIFSLTVWHTLQLSGAQRLEEAFPSDETGHSALEAKIVEMTPVNVLAIPGTEMTACTIADRSEAPELTDGLAGVWVGGGRVQCGGKTPSVAEYKLPCAVKLDRVVLCTSNSDSRANHDFEVELLNDDGYTLKISSGNRVIGRDAGPYLTSIPVESELRFSRIRYRIWGTYPTKSGTPGKEQTSASSWCSVVELLALTDEDSMQSLFPNVDAYKTWCAAKLEAVEKLKAEARAKFLSQLTGGISEKLPAFERALNDLYASHPERFKDSGYRARLEKIKSEAETLTESVLKTPDPKNSVTDAQKAAFADLSARFHALQREALLSNPLLDGISELLVVRRSYSSPRMGLPTNWESNSTLPHTGFDDAIVRIPLKSAETKLDWAKIPVVYRPEKPYFVGDVDLNWDADKILFSSVGANDRWQVFEYALDGKSAPRELTADEPDIDSYDACYLPDGRIIYTSTAMMAGVPCVYGHSHIATLFLMNADGSAKRQLAFDQEHSWNPCVLNNGRILYQRWEYADLPHSNSRQLFQCNPDGTGQLSYYSSNSYWPNSFWYARPIPGHRSMVVSVITGHHDSHRAGELCLFDPALGRNEADGCVQRIPGFGKKVEPIIKDGPVKDSWPKFLHPYPLSEKYFLVSCKPSPHSKWGLYLVDVFDNMTLLYEDDQYALLEPFPLVKRERPMVIPDRVDLTRKDAEAYIADVYNGPGLKDVPRGTIKQLRLITYHFAYQNMGGLMGVVGVDGPWDIKEVLGTVPVHPDGSARFRIPANTPIAFQPLDESGQALQIMRSWTTAMPGEILQCNGCHEDLNQAAVPKTTTGFLSKPDEITPWYGQRRGFAYAREVQPIIDKYCLACHDGSKEDAKYPDLRGTVYVSDYRSVQHGNGTGHIRRNSHFTVGYFNLQKYVRRPGIESDMHLLEPKEFAADTTELVQMLRHGHHGVRLSAQAWDRLLTWIDLNCPFHGTWTEATKDPDKQRSRRMELAKLYGNLDPHDAEAIYPTDIEKDGPIMPPEELQKADERKDPVIGIQIETASGTASGTAPLETKTVRLPNGPALEFVRVPAGTYTVNGKTARIEKPFWISTREIRNDQFRAFDPTHDSRVESKHCYQFGIHGYPMNQPFQPVCRVTNADAQKFCAWLTEQLGGELTCALPTATQWEWAARAGQTTPFFYGTKDSDFGQYANLADLSMKDFATNPYTVDQKYSNLTQYDDWIPSEKRFSDGMLLTAAPGSYRPNAWGLYDVHGNVAEWTRTQDEAGNFLIKGGSWYDRPYRAAVHVSRSAPVWQRLFDVGFRVVLEEK